MNKTVEVNIDEKKYVVKFPNVGQTLDIESMKMSLTGNKYPELVMSPLKTTEFAADLVDAIATFFVMIPELRGNLNVKSYSELDVMSGAKLIKAYLTDYYPFYKDIMTEVYKFQKDGSKTEE